MMNEFVARARATPCCGDRGTQARAADSRWLVRFLPRGVLGNIRMDQGSLVIFALDGRSINNKKKILAKCG